jgi:hypothetical protein
MSISEQEMVAFMATTNERFRTMEEKFQPLIILEPSLEFLHANLEFFRNLFNSLETRLRALEVMTLESAPARLKSLETTVSTFDRSSLVTEVTGMTYNSLREDIISIQKTMDDFRRDATALYATKSELEVSRPTTTTISSPSTKGKMALPEVFSGKREDWKVFASHLTLYLSAHKDSYPLDSDKITFAVSRLGNGSAFKYMMEFIPKLDGPVALRPPVVTNFELFLKTMKDTFGVQNANVVSEAQLLQLRQKGSAVDYTNKFLELSSDLSGWTDAPLITHYRHGLKPEVVKAIDGLQVVPATFSEFTQKAIELDSKQYATYLELQNRSPASTPSRLPATNLIRRPTSTPTVFPSPVPTPAPSMAMDLSQVRHITPEEKKRRLEKGLCLYCGEGNHLVKVCPNKKTLASTELAETSPDFEFVDFTLGNDQA